MAENSKCSKNERANRSKTSGDECCGERKSYQVSEDGVEKKRDEDEE